VQSGAIEEPEALRDARVAQPVEGEGRGKATGFLGKGSLSRGAGVRGMHLRLLILYRLLKTLRRRTSYGLQCPKSVRSEKRRRSTSSCKRYGE